MAELKERMSAGGVSAEEVAEAFKHATSEGGQFYQAMEAQRPKTFNGQMSTLKDNAMSFIRGTNPGRYQHLKGFGSSHGQWLAGGAAKRLYKQRCGGRCYGFWLYSG